METKTETPNVGTPAPPIDPDDVPGLTGAILKEKPKIKQKNRSLMIPFIIFGALFALIVGLVLVFTMTTGRSSTAVVAIVGDDRIEPPATLPEDILMRGQPVTTWQPDALPALAWHGWMVLPNAGEQITFSVNPTTEGFTPILGLYDSDGRLIAKSQDDRTTPEKTLTYKFTNAGTYTILVSNIGGAFGRYEIRAQTAQ